MTLYEICKKVTEEKQFTYIKAAKGCKDSTNLLVSEEKKRGYAVLDGFSASAYKALYEALNEEKRAKLLALPALTGIEVAFKVIKGR